VRRVAESNLLDRLTTQRLERASGDRSILAERIGQRVDLRSLDDDTDDPR